MSKPITYRLQWPRMKGQGVARLQELLEDIGHYNSEIDGIYGPMTEAAVMEFQFQNWLKSDGICGVKTYAALIANANKDAGAHLNNSAIDIRGDHDHPRLYGGKRKWSTIDSVVLHQTGCGMPDNPRAWKNLNAHFGITQQGVLVWVNDATDMIWHAQGLSKRSIGIEIEGNYYGVEGNESTLWAPGGGPDNINPKMLTAIKSLFALLVGEFGANGATWKYIFAHRQSSNMRTSDPGEQIWKQVAIPWADRLALGDKWYGGKRFKVGKGKTILKEWM